MASRPETIVKMNKAWELHKIGLSIREIGERLQPIRIEGQRIAQGPQLELCAREYYPIA